MEITRLNDIPRKGPVSILLFGGSGVGKSFLCGTGGDRCCIIDCGLGPTVETMQSATFKKKVGANPIVIQVREEYDPETKIPLGKAFDNVTDAIDFMLAEHLNDFDILCIDTGIREFALTKGLYINQALGRSKTLAGMKEQDLAMVVPAVQDFGMEMGAVEWFCATYIDLCKKLGKHFMLTAHTRLNFTKPRDGKGNIIIGEAPIVSKIRPGFTGVSFPDDIPALFDEVWYLEVVSEVHRIKTEGDDILVAKTTKGSGILKRIETDPNLLKLLARMQA